MRFFKAFVVLSIFFLYLATPLMGNASVYGDTSGGADLVQAGRDYSQSQRYSYTGLTDAEKSYLKEKGYSDEQIEKFSSEFGKNYVENGTDIADWSEEETNMLSDLYNHDKNNSINGGRLKQIAQETEDADNKNLSEILSNPLKAPWEALVNWIAGKQETSFPTILNAFTSSTVGNGCWFCGIFETLFETINSLAVKTNDTLATMIVGDGWAWNSTYSLLGLLLFGYIIYVVGKAFLSINKLTEPMELFSQVFFPTMRCMIAALLIWNIQSIYTYMLDPLLTASIGFGQNVMESGINTSGYSASASLSNGAYVSSKCKSYYTLNNSLLVNLTGGASAEIDFRNPNASTGTFYEYAPSNPGMHKNVNQAIQCFLDTASQNLITWMAVGASFIADCWKIALKNFFGSIQMFIIGLIIFIGSFLIFLAFPLKLLDSLFRLMFVTALMPLWIAFWVIPQTRKYTKNAWGMLEHVLITFIVLSVILVMVLTIIEKMFDKNVSGIDIETIAQALLKDKSVKGLEYINFTGVGIFMTAALMYLAFSLIGKTDSFVNHFASGGGDMGMGKEMAGHAIQGTQLAASVGAAGVAAGWRFLNKKRGGDGAKGPGGPTVGLPTPPAPHREFGPGSGKTGGGEGPAPTAPTPKPKVTSSSSRENLPDGKTKDTSMKTFTDENGKVTHKEVGDTIKDAKGRVESKSLKRESFDPATGNKTGSSTIDTHYNADGTSTQVKTDYDAMDRKKSTLTTTNAGTTKTEFDTAGREKTITMKDRAGNTSVETNNYDATGKRVSFFTESKDAAGKITEKFKVDLNTNKKIDILTGKVSSYVP